MSTITTLKSFFPLAPIFVKWTKNPTPGIVKEFCLVQKRFHAHWFSIMTASSMVLFYQYG